MAVIFNNLHFFATAQTKAISRALASIGIGIENALPTLEDITINSELLKGQEEKVVEKKAPKKDRQPKPVSIEDTLLRLRVAYTVENGRYVIKSKRLKDKTLAVLSRYGFEKDGSGNLTAKKEEKEEKDEREEL